MNLLEWSVTTCHFSFTLDSYSSNIMELKNGQNGAMRKTWA